MRGEPIAAPFDLICLSHLRWDFVYQRPQHLMSRFARERRVFFFEEAILVDDEPRLEVRTREEGLSIVVPHLPPDASHEDWGELQRELIDGLMREHEIEDYVLWYYTPMALLFTRQLEPLATVYDCMDELSAFADAPALLKELDRELLERADLLFTGGQSIYQARRTQHPHVYAFPSSVDTEHFRTARAALPEPPDQASIGRPRIGFYGVVDERMDFDLVDAAAQARADWQFVVVGPVVKVGESRLPRRENVHYLGAKTYDELPAYLAGWDVAVKPFALNEETRLISPTQTPQYLPAGKPVVSTPIRDVLHPYGDEGLVRIADSPDSFVAAVEAALEEDGERRTSRADRFLARTSWQRTYERMNELLDAEVARRTQPSRLRRVGTRAATEASSSEGSRSHCLRV